MSELKPKKCRRNPKILCGVVKNVGNCPFHSDKACQDNNDTNLFGTRNLSFGTIVLKKYRYNVHKVRMDVLEENMCQECRVIWNKPLDKCPICKTEE